MLFRIKERINATIAAVIGSVAFLGCGLVFSLYLAPQQKLEARAIERLPIMDSQSISQANAGDDILITGRLVDNSVLVDGEKYVAYSIEEWDISLPDYDSSDSDQEPSGNWRTTDRIFPELQIEVNGNIVRTLASASVNINGSVHQAIHISEGYYSAEYMGELIPEGSLKYRGFYNGDLITAWGVKASSDGIILKELYGGDRVAYVESQHKAAKGLLVAGIAMVVCSPAILLGGVLVSIFGRRRRQI